MTAVRPALVLGILLFTYAAPPARERRVPVGSASLYTREIGRGPAAIVLHGGPDFDHSYFLPELDRLSDAYRLIYYDQRGRGKSAEGVRPEDVTIDSEMSDLGKVLESYQLRSTALLGHSWGAVLAMEYAIRHPDRVSRLILMNPAPASSGDWAQFRKFYAERIGRDINALRAAAATPAYKGGDPDAVAAYYRIHFRPALARPDQVDTIVTRLRASFTRQGILKARAIEARLVGETWGSARYDLFPQLAKLRVPTLVIYSEHDFIPPSAAEHIAATVPAARSVRLKDCGHFSYFDCSAAVHAAIDGLFRQ
jgi:proline-specific peptidase